MTTSAPVPADDDFSVIDLVEDCREVSGVLAPYVPGEIRLPLARPVPAVEIDLSDAEAVAGVGSWNDYGA
ncbi:MAG TPA: hypothetical protein VNU66_00705 [Mycobacteriales bacterium]|nr:hypothetical protein [Mycobacteriales bacterium]